MFHKHKWKVISAFPVQWYDNSYGQLSTYPTHFYTDIAMSCADCGDVKTKTIKGNFTVEQLRGT